MKKMPETSFRDVVYRLMSRLPANEVTTYGDIATLAGYATRARQVGEIAHGGPTELPWHRLVNYQGRLAIGFPGGPAVQRQLLEQDGILCDESRVIHFEERRWRPIL